MAVQGQGLRVWLACDWFVKYVSGLAVGLDEIGCSVVMLTRDHDQEFGGSPGGMHEFLAARIGAGIEHRELRGRVSDPRALAATVGMRRAAGAWRPDVVHVQDSLANDPRLGLASGLPPRPYALTIHDPVPHPGDALARRSTTLFRKVLRRGARLVFVHSEELREELLEVGGTAAPIVVVPHGVGTPEPIPLPERPSLLFFGRMSYYKGLDILLDAMPTVWGKLPELTLTIAGEGEIERHVRLEDRRVEVRREHVTEAELPALFGAASCVVLPYRQASQSGVGSLAREHGRAVVATRVGGLPELVDEDWGRLVAPEDPAALAEAIIEVIGTPGLAARMGASAADALGASSWRSVAEQTVAAYRAHMA